MRTLVTIGTFGLAATMFASPALAEEAPTDNETTTSLEAAIPEAAGAEDDGKRIGVGADLLFTLPIGDMADATGPLIGASIRAGYYVMPQFEAYVRGGYKHGLTKETSVPLLGSVKTGVSDIPILVGGRYFFLEPYAGLYGNLEIGVHLLSTRIEAGGTSMSSDTETRFGANIGAGYVISKELPINIGAQFSLLNLLGTESGEKTMMGINIMAGYEARF